MTITSSDFMVLEELVRQRLPSGTPAAYALIGKLKRCRVVPPHAVAADVVTLDTCVVFSVDGGEADARILVHPAGHAVAGLSLPVTAPRGLAMLGLHVGSTAVAEHCGGRTERIDILSLAYQPENAARRGRTALPAGAL